MPSVVDSTSAYQGDEHAISIHSDSSFDLVSLQSVMAEPSTHYLTSDDGVEDM